MALRTLIAAFALAALPAAVLAQPAKPQYGGQLTIGTPYITIGALSWDPADYNWKHNVDTGLVYEQLFAADLTKAKRNGGPFPYYADAWLPPESIRGELAEKWEWKQNPLRMEIQLRKGVMFPAKPGVMEARELVADDVVYAYDRLNKSPKKIANYFDHVEKVEATGKHTVVFTFNSYNAEWDYRFGWGYYSAIVPKEVVTAGANNWKNANGTGPYQLTDYVQNNSYTYTKNAGYWDTDTIGGQKYKLPFADKIVYRTIKDEATWLTGLRTGKIDVLEAVRWSAVDELKKSAPKLQWSRWLGMSSTFLAMRMDTKPFDDIRVRRAMNLAVNKQEILKSYFGGHAEMMGFPQHPDYVGSYEPLEAMGPAVKELFTYDPAKAKQLLAEAGYPNGFTFKVQATAVTAEADLLAMLGSYLSKVGVKMEIQQLEYGAFLSAMNSKKHAAGYFMTNSPTNPTTSLRKQFVTGQQWNVSMYADPDFDRRLNAVLTEPDERRRLAMTKLMTREVIEKAPYIWLPVQYVYTAWWPWVKNYGGELRAGAARPGPIHARMWVDQDLKKKMGY